MSARFKSGYTLVEILIGLTIISIVFSIGVASYREFSRRQELNGYIKKTISDIRLIQQKALSGQKPDASLGSCTRLDAYSLVTNGGSSYSIVANCVNGNVTIKSVDLGNITVTATTAVTRFKVLGLGTDLPSDNTLTFRSTLTGNTSSLIIGKGGDVK